MSLEDIMLEVECMVNQIPKPPADPVERADGGTRYYYWKETGVWPTDEYIRQIQAKNAEEESLCPRCGTKIENDETFCGNPDCPGRDW